MLGKRMRLAQMFTGSRMFVVPMDHSATLGPIKGLECYTDTITKIKNSGADAIVLHKGLLKRVASNDKLVGFSYIMHLSASINWDMHPNYKVLVGDVEEAIQLGALGVSMHVNLNTEHVSDMIKDFGYVSKMCQNWGMPLLAMMYVADESTDDGRVIHAARIAEELGADIVKIPHPGQKQLEAIISSTTIPVVISGGSKMDKFQALLPLVDNCLSVGVRGIAIGRNIFQQNDIEGATRLLADLVHGNRTLQECMAEMANNEQGY